MNKAQIDDFKQFLVTTVSQSEGRLRQEMAEGFAAIGDSLMELNDRLDKQYQQINRRLSLLEARI